ncbi:MAG: VOC family protein [Dehalococcoidia bacterium]|nr:VOC family protein [Dehalococcoidia bacterium]
MAIPDVESPWDGRHRNAVTPEGSEADASLHLDIDHRSFADQWGGQDVPGGALIGFRVASREGLDVLYERVTAAGHPGVREPYDTFWGSRYAIVLDPSGVAVGLMSPMDPDMRSAPPRLDHT